MKGLGAQFVGIVGVTAVLYILVSGKNSGDIIKQLGGATTNVIAALQARPVNSGL